MLDALGDATRRAILERLREGPRAVVDIARACPSAGRRSRSTFRLLKDAGLVIDERRGNRRLYEIDPRAMEELESYARSFWSAAMTRYARTAARERDADAADGPRDRGQP